MMTFLIRADGDSKMGSGHIMRMIGLGQYLAEKGSAIVFVSKCDNQYLLSRISEAGAELVNIAGKGVDKLLDIAHQRLSSKSEFMPWIILDGYGFTGEDQSTIKEKGFPLLFVDDYGHAERYSADLVLNQNLSADKGLYTVCGKNTELLLGADYSILRKEFRNLASKRRDIPSKARKLLITLGGADPGNVTEKIVRALDNIALDGLDVRVVIGPANVHLESVKTAAGSINVPCSVITQPNMPEELARADIAIIGAGTTCMEVAFMGLPTMTVILADNQVKVACTLAESGVTVNLGWYNRLSSVALSERICSFAEDAGLRSRCSVRGQEMVDGRGVERIERRIKARSIRIRPAIKTDSELVWGWANDPTVRKVSFSSDPIPWGDHVRWYDGRMSRSDIKYYIIETDRGIPMGQARFEPDGDETVISVIMDSSFRGRGFGSVMIAESCIKYNRDAEQKVVTAYIKPDNSASIRAFSGAGFADAGVAKVKGHDALRMRYEMGNLS